MKSMTAAEIKKGDQIRKPGKWEMWVECVKTTEDGRLIIWGAEVQYLNPSDHVILVQATWGES